jgi:hypothetical protein
VATPIELMDCLGRRAIHRKWWDYFILYFMTFALNYYRNIYGLTTFFCVWWYQNLNSGLCVFQDRDSTARVTLPVHFCYGYFVNYLPGLALNHDPPDLLCLQERCPFLSHTSSPMVDFFLTVVGFDLRDPHLLGRCTT